MRLRTCLVGVSSQYIRVLQLGMALKSELKLNLFPSSDRKVLRKQVGSYMRMHGNTNGNTNIPAGQVFDIALMQAPFTLDAPLLAYNELTCVRRTLLNLPLGLSPFP